MKEKLYAVISNTTGNCIAICANIEDAWEIEKDYTSRRTDLYPKWSYEVKAVTRAQAVELVGREWVDSSTSIEMILTKSSVS